ncbi:MAG: RES domain-containing protein [Mycobacteriales bacterium]|nr:RES domain-containing protein [Mycobacteriales bacterium]
MSVAPPPSDLTRFPRLRPADQRRALYRIFHARHHRTGRPDPAWHYSSAVAPGEGNRFDLRAPHGTCYWSDRKYGAWVEVFRGALLVDAEDARARRLHVAIPPDLRAADLTAPRAYSFGVTAEISTTGDYTLPQAWAGALHAAGFDALRGTCRHDPSSRAHDVAVFGRSGPAARRLGWRTTRDRVETDLELRRELDELGVATAPVPHTVPVTPPPGTAP